MPTAYRRKLIEVDLPLDAISAESVRERSINHGHPSTLHQWWARRPLASCRAVVFASLVDDPVDCPEEFPDADTQAAERERLHDLIRRLVVWKNSDDASLLAEARYEIARSVARSHDEAAPTEPAAVLDYLNRQAKPIYDPFCGGGSIPLEAQRLGLRSVGSDLNPVAVLITKALIELPPKFANRPPVNPDGRPHGYDSGQGKEDTKGTLARRRRLGRRHPLLWAQDARDGLGTRRPPVSQSSTARWWRGYRGCLAVGTYRALPQPGLWRGDASTDHIPSNRKARQRALVMARS